MSRSGCWTATITAMTWPHLPWAPTSSSHSHRMRKPLHAADSGTVMPHPFACPIVPPMRMTMQSQSSEFVARAIMNERARIYESVSQYSGAAYLGYSAGDPLREAVFVLHPYLDFVT